MTSPARLREHEVLAAALSALCADRNATGSTFCLGAMAALRWLTEGGPGPLTGALIGKPVTLRVIVGELSAAEAVIYGRPSDQRRYAAGVEHALMWAQFATSTPPAPVVGGLGVDRVPVMVVLPRAAVGPRRRLWCRVG